MDFAEIRKQFPILNQKTHGKRLAYLDSGASSQKPQCVIDAITHYYTHDNANIHRGIHTLSERATDQFEQARKKVAEFINAETADEIIFTKNATESMNLVAYSFGKLLKEGDEIIVSAFEHHANLVPWQELVKEKKLKMHVIPLTENFDLDYKELENMLSKDTKLVAVSGMSNVTGTIIDIKKITTAAHKVGARVCVDGSQLAVHKKVDVQALNCDFFAMTAHKMCGPTGVGILYGKKEVLDLMPPYQTGGDMVDTVEQFEAVYNDAPSRFEAGTPNIAGVIGFKAALDFLEEIGIENIDKHDSELLEYAIKCFEKYPVVKIFAPKDPAKRGSLFTFTIEGIHPHDIAEVFDKEGVAIRSGSHCAHPLMKELETYASARISIYLYNTKEDIDQAEKAFLKVCEVFGVDPMGNEQQTTSKGANEQMSN